MRKEVVVKAGQIKQRRKVERVAKITVLVLLLFLITIYILLQIVYSEGKFTVTLDSVKELQSGLVIYESLEDDTPKRKLEATPISFMDNISYKWLPEDVEVQSDGSHNGDNYIAYSFYVENLGKEDLIYWYELVIDDVIKNVDDAIRIRIYLNGEETTYAKKNDFTGQAEPGTKEFLEKEDGSVILEKRENFVPGTLDRITVVVWLEGDDPECVDSLIGGELKMHMKITEEHIEEQE